MPVWRYSSRSCHCRTRRAPLRPHLPPGQQGDAGAIADDRCLTGMMNLTRCASLPPFTFCYNARTVYCIDCRRCRAIASQIAPSVDSSVRRSGSRRFVVARDNEGGIRVSAYNRRTRRLRNRGDRDRSPEKHRRIDSQTRCDCPAPRAEKFAFGDDKRYTERTRVTPTDLSVEAHSCLSLTRVPHSRDVTRARFLRVRHRIEAEKAFDGRRSDLRVSPCSPSRPAIGGISACTTSDPWEDDGR